MRWAWMVLALGCGASQTVPAENAREPDVAQPQPECVAALVDALWPDSAALVAEAERFASMEQSVAVFDALDEVGRRTRAYDAGGTARREGVADAMYAITDETGRVIAIDRDRNRGLGRHVPFVEAAVAAGGSSPVVADTAAIGGLEAVAMGGVAPIQNVDGAVIGAAVVVLPLAVEEWSVRSRHQVLLVGGDAVASSAAGLEAMAPRAESAEVAPVGIEETVAGRPHVGAMGRRGEIAWVLLRPADDPCPAALAPAP